MRINRILTAIVLLFAAISCDNDLSTGLSTGQGGSMTRFAIKGNYLYVVDNSTIQVFLIDGDEFESVGEEPIAFGLETIFSNGDHLYLGANDAMYIYSIADPEKPSFVFRYSHIVSCDPVVVQGDRAYVTMRSGTRCNRGANALEILDISDRNNPTLIANFPAATPHGLAVDGNLLFLCHGESGLSMFDISNERDIKVLKTFDLHSFDVIARSGILTLTGEDGVYQFRYSETEGTLEMISQIPVLRTNV